LHAPGNVTGFNNTFETFGQKWLQLLKDAVPHIARVALLFNPDIYAGVHFASIDATAPVLGLQAIRTPVRNNLEIVRSIDALNGAVLVLPATSNMRLVIQATTEHRLPTIFPNRQFVEAGGLMSAADLSVNYRGVASYVDRILRGAKVNELPVQYPTRFELVVNLKTAKAIGLTTSETFLAFADKVIE
jgi:putative ABC transport system substrate-binding protein